MSFDISMEFLGLNEMQKEIERLSTESEQENHKTGWRNRLTGSGRTDTEESIQ